MYKVVQCWDDGPVNDIKLIEICRKYNATATFNLNPGLMQTGRWKGGNYKNMFQVYKIGKSEIKSVYEGFELASHTMTHPRPTQIEPESFRKEAVDARHFLEDVVQRELLGFAYPFGDFNDVCMNILREEGFAYARTCKNAANILHDTDPMAQPTNCKFDNPEFYSIWEAAKPTGVFYFWGHSYELMDSPELWDRYEKLVADISSDPDAQWVNLTDIFNA